MGRHSRPAPANRQAVWAVAGTLATGLVQWLLIAVLAVRSGPEAVGAYSLSLAIAAPVFTFSMLQLRMLLVTERDPREWLSRYLATRLLTSAASLALLAAVAAILHGPATSLLLPVAATRFFETIGDLLLAALQAEGHVDRVGRIQVGYAAAGLAAYLGTAVVVGDALRAVWALPVAALVVGAWVPWLAVRAHAGSDWLRLDRASFAPATLRHVLGKGLPLGGSSTITSISASVPRYALQAVSGSATVGVFAGVSQLSQGVSSVVGALAQAHLPQLARRYHAGGREAVVAPVVGALAACLGIGGLLAAPAYLWGPDLVRALYGADFAVSREMTALYAVLTGVVSCGWFLDQALVTLRRVHAQLVVNAGALAVVAVGCVSWAPAHGLIGVTAAAVLGALVQVIAKTALILGGATRVPEAVAA